MGRRNVARVVEAAGMSAHCDFSEQTASGENRPDLIVKLPGERFIIIDAKVPDFDFLHALESADETRRAESLLAHATKLKETIRGLAARDYPRQFLNALDYVVLFVPAESLFSAALEGDRDLIIWAAEKRILLATPASLIALLRSVSVSWQQHSQTENAQKIADAAQELFSRVVKFTEHFEKIRSGLERANSAFNDATSSFQSRVRPAGERLAELGGGTGQRIGGRAAAGWDVAAAGIIYFYRRRQTVNEQKNCFSHSRKEDSSIHLQREGTHRRAANLWRQCGGQGIVASVSTRRKQQIRATTNGKVV